MGSVAYEEQTKGKACTEGGFFGNKCELMLLCYRHCSKSAPGGRSRGQLTSFCSGQWVWIEGQFQWRIRMA